MTNWSFFNYVKSSLFSIFSPMRYLSPASLPESPPLSPPDKKAWALLRRKLLAEVELSADGTLSIKGRTFTKNDILEYFEGLQDETILSYHAAVAEDQVLAHFLEASQFPAEGCFAEAPIYDDGRFIEWISPWFYSAFVGCVTDYLERANEDELRSLLLARFLLTEYDRERAWMQIGNLLENDVAQLNQYLQKAAADKQQIPFPIEELYPYTDESLIRMIRMFPERQFAGVRNSYAAVLMDLSIHIFNKDKDNRPLAKKWLTHAKQLAVSKDLAAAPKSY